MARFAGQALQTTPTQQKPVIGEFNAEDFQDRPQEVALAPAIPIAAGVIGKGMKAYGAFKLGQTMLDGGKVNSGLQHREPGQQREANPVERLGKLIMRNDY